LAEPVRGLHCAVSFLHQLIFRVDADFELGASLLKTSASMKNQLYCPSAPVTLWRATFRSVMLAFNSSTADGMTCRATSSAALIKARPAKLAKSRAKRLLRWTEGLESRGCHGVLSLSEWGGSSEGTYAQSESSRPNGPDEDRQ
jgi:hypothetical protein